MNNFIEFEANQVFAPGSNLNPLKEPVRFICRNADLAIFIPLSSQSGKTGLLYLSTDQWMKALYQGDLETCIADPYDWMPHSTDGLRLPIKAMQRLKTFHEILGRFKDKEDLLFDKRGLLKFFQTQASAVTPKRSVDTVKRWFLAWLRAGRNPLAVIENFLVKKPVVRQRNGAKRGRPNPTLPLASVGPAFEFEEKIQDIYKRHIKTKKMLPDDAYTLSLTTHFGIAEADRKEFFLNEKVAAQYKVPGRAQFLKAIQRIRKNEAPEYTELPKGERGNARDYAPGPGYFEIDATYFQIQLISRSGARNLISRPLVYLIVDIFSGVIVGYTVSLENPSWAVAGLALHNCFTDKQYTFDKLNLKFSSADWPCHHLPTVLRADRGEFVSDMAQRFPESKIRLEITPSYTPEAKGTVEGKNSELKRPNVSKFDLPGLYKKFRTRGESDGKWDAALNIDQFERIIVEMIMLLNRQPVLKKNLPRDAIRANVSNRMQLWSWGLEHRSGYTERATSNFVHEHLLSRGTGILKPNGIYFKQQKYNCDLLREFKYLQTAPRNGRPIEISFHNNFAGEIFFRAPDQSWKCAYNDDVEVSEMKLSFHELKEEASQKVRLGEQGAMDATDYWGSRESLVKEEIKAAKTEAKQFRKIGGVSKSGVRDARSAERRKNRSGSLNGSIPINIQDGIQEAPARAFRSTPSNRTVLKYEDETE